MSAENKSLVRRWFKEIWNKGNLARADQIVAPNYMSQPAMVSHELQKLYHKRNKIRVSFVQLDC